MTKPTLLTTAAGIPVADNQNSLSAGPYGPLLLQDFHLVEKLAHFNRERIPERVVHAKGAGAYGTFTVTQDISRYTKAKLFATVGKTTPIFIRFSTVGGEKGSADTDRDPRGFAIKFYTEEGNWDIVGNNTPVFFIRDPLKFPDFIHTQKRCPQTNLKSANMKWDFWSLSPEAMHQITILFSDRGTPKSYRHMDGFGSHTFSMINHANERFWVKFHFKTVQGIQNNSAFEAEQLAGTDPDHATRDLFNAIAEQNYPKWQFYIQVMPEADAEQYAIDPFDLTKVWPHADYPLLEVGTLELNQNPENYFAEVEQAAFTPANVVPGISFSPDKVLQGRLFAYADAHRYRLGINHNTIPVNQAKVKACPYHRDGGMRVDGNGGNSANYEPNSFNGPSADSQFKEPALNLKGHADRYNHRDNNDDYTQAGNLFRLLDKEAQDRLIANIVASMQGVPEAIQKRQLFHFYQADPHYGQGIAEGLGIKL